MSEMRRCQGCGRRNTGWRAVPHWGKWVCPACAQGIQREPAGDALARRRALLARLEQEEPHPGIDRFKDEVRAGIERLERREAEGHEGERIGAQQAPAH